MAKAKKKNDVTIDMLNEVYIHGVIKNVLTMTDKVAIYFTEVYSKSPKGNVIKCWVKVVDFNREIDFEPGDAITVDGELSTNIYKGKNGDVFEIRVNAKDISTLDVEVPFN